MSRNLKPPALAGGVFTFASEDMAERMAFKVKPCACVQQCASTIYMIQKIILEQCFDTKLCAVDLHHIVHRRSLKFDDIPC